MKKPTSLSAKQQGFTLIEALVGLVIFAIIILGNGAATSRMLHAQKETNADFIILNLMQNKMQNALTRADSNDICSAINTDNFSVGDRTYYMACGLEHVEINGTTVNWPVLAVSKELGDATACAQGQLRAGCYVVGR